MAAGICIEAGFPPPARSAGGGLLEGELCPKEK